MRMNIINKNSPVSHDKEELGEFIIQFCFLKPKRCKGINIFPNLFSNLSRKAKQHQIVKPLIQHIPPFGDGIAESVPIVGRQSALHTCHGKDELTPDNLGLSLHRGQGDIGTHLGDLAYRLDIRIHLVLCLGCPSTDDLSDGDAPILGVVSP